MGRSVNSGPVNTIEDKAAIIEKLDQITDCNEFIQLIKNKQVKVLEEAGIEDVNCQKI